MKLYGAERPLELLSYIMHRCKSHRTTSDEFWEEKEHDELRTPGWTEMLFSFRVIFNRHFYQCTVTVNGLSGSSDGVKLCFTLCSKNRWTCQEVQQFGREQLKIAYGQVL